MKSIVLAVRPAEQCVHLKRNRLRRTVLLMRYFLKKYGMAAFFITILLSGMVVGASCAGIKHGEYLSKAVKAVTEHIIVQQNTTAIGVFADSFTVSFVFAAAMILMSMSPFGMVTIPIVMLARGVCCGIVSGYLCVTYGLKGLVYYICVMLIGTFISSLALVYVSQYCMDFSFSVFRGIFYKNNIYGNETLRNKLGIMILNTSYMLILIGFASLADTVLFFLLGGLFSF